MIAARDAAPDNASARLEALGLAYVTFAVSSLGYFRVMFHGGSTSTGPTEAGLRTFNILRDAVVACQEAGQAPKGDATGLVLVAWSAVHGFATLVGRPRPALSGTRARAAGARNRTPHHANVFGAGGVPGLTPRTLAPQARRS